MQYQSEHINELATALAKAQADMTHVTQDGKNTYHKSNYSTIAAISAEARRTLPKHGLSYTQPIISSDNKHTLLTILMHSSGQFIVSRFDINMETIIQMSKVWHKDSKQFIIGNVDQKLGASITYHRRYALLSILGLAPGEKEDDDGNSLDQTDVKLKESKEVKVEESPKINAEQVQYFKDMLKFYGKDVEKRFWDALKKSNKHRIEDIPLKWYDQVKNYLAGIIAEVEATKHD